MGSIVSNVSPFAHVWTCWRMKHSMTSLCSLKPSLYEKGHGSGSVCKPTSRFLSVCGSVHGSVMNHKPNQTNAVCTNPIYTILLYAAKHKLAHPCFSSSHAAGLQLTLNLILFRNTSKMILGVAFEICLHGKAVIWFLHHRITWVHLCFTTLRIMWNYLIWYPLSLDSLQWIIWIFQEVSSLGTDQAALFYHIPLDDSSFLN